MTFIRAAAFILTIGSLWVQTLRLGSKVQLFKEAKEKAGEESVITTISAANAAPNLICSVILLVIAILLFFLK